MDTASKLPSERHEDQTGYERHFDLKEAPFALTANPRYVFESRSLSGAVDEITQALGRHEPLIVITGRAGTGKTLICRTLANLRDPRTFVAVVATAPASRDDLLRQLLDQFGLLSAASGAAAAASRFELVRTLEQFLASLAKVNSRAVVVVDEAHRLSDEVLDELRWLSNFETETRKLLQIVLLGEPVLDEMIERPEFSALRQRVTRRHTLGTLTPDEVAPYIERRLQVARGDRHSPGLFTRGAVDAVVALAQGVPRVVNVLCDRALHFAYQQSRGRVDRAEVLAAARTLHYDVSLPNPRRRQLSIAAAAVAAFVVGGTIVWWVAGRDTRSSQASGATPPPVADASRSAPTPAAGPGAVPPAPPSNAQASATSPVVSRPASGSTGSSGSTGQPFDVLASSFRSQARAEALVREAATLGLPARVRSSGAWHQVIVGPYATRDEAGKAREALKQLFIPDAEIVASLPAPSAPPDESLGTATPDDIMRRATTMSKAPDVKGLTTLRRQVESRPGTDATADSERTAMLKQIDALLEDARRRQLEIDSQSYTGAKPSGPQ